MKEIVVGASCGGSRKKYKQLMEEPHNVQKYISRFLNRKIGKMGIAIRLTDEDVINKSKFLLSTKETRPGNVESLYNENEQTF
jgi:hypothetical protein